MKLKELMKVIGEEESVRIQSYDSSIGTNYIAESPDGRLTRPATEEEAEAEILSLFAIGEKRLLVEIVKSKGEEV